MIYLAPALGILGLVVMAFKSAWVSKQDAGDANMQELAGYIADGAMAFLKAEWRVLSIFVLITAVLLAYSGTVHKVNGKRDPLELGDLHRVYHRRGFLGDSRLYRDEGRDKGQRPNDAGRPNKPEAGAEGVVHRRNGNGPRRCGLGGAWTWRIVHCFLAIFADLAATRSRPRPSRY